MDKDVMMNMFGCDIDELMKDYVYGTRDPIVRCTGMAISILSDSQEEMARWRLEDARKRINVAKYLISMAEEGKMYGTMDGVPLEKISEGA